MAKRQNRTSDSLHLAPDSRDILPLIALAASGGLILLMVFRGEDMLSLPRPAWGVALSMFALHALLAFALSEFIPRCLATRAWRYRLAFLISLAAAPFSEKLCMPATGFSYLAWQAAASPIVGSFLLALIGAFFGGLTASARCYGWYENNAPPSAEVVAFVHNCHRAWLGPLEPEPLGKRLFDMSLALFGLLLSLPFWCFSAMLIWWQDPGPVLFVKNSVGKGGVNFRQFKLRTMVRGAEDQTGPVLSDENDRRILPFGSFLRKTALDELPQLINILRGEMSFVGPRPQRTVLVAGYLQHMPQYAQRHLVLPGLSGLAQVAGDYFLTPLQKLRYDRVYIHNRSFTLDVTLLFLACLITFWYRWQPGWNGRLPRRLLRLGWRRRS